VAVRFLLLLCMAMTVSGCSVRQAVDGRIPAADGPPAPFPECEADEYLYIGRNTLSGLELRDTQGLLMSGPDASRAGMIWVTADPVAHEPMPDAEQPPPTRMVCLQFADGSGMSTGVDDDWRPPGLVGDSETDDASSARPVGLLVAALVVVGIVGASVIAFRGRPESTSS
jgi:hypothetical protein